MSLFIALSTKNGVYMTVNDPSTPEELKLFDEAMRLIRQQHPDKVTVTTNATITTKASKPAKVVIPPEEIFKAEELGVIERDGRVMVSSRDVSRVCGKRHNDVLRSIRIAECSKEFRARNFAQSSYKNSQGKSQPEYLMTRDGFTFLVMGFTGKLAAKFKEAYINAFNTMEAVLRSKQITA